jgi:hypothetical protein
MQTFKERWAAVQGAFVDDPRAAVQQADGLVAEVLQDVATRFATEKDRLERDWAAGADVDTEALRIALQHYRAFFDRLLNL